MEKTSAQYEQYRDRKSDNETHAFRKIVGSRAVLKWLLLCGWFLGDLATVWGKFAVFRLLRWWFLVRTHTDCRKLKIILKKGMKLFIKKNLQKVVPGVEEI